MIKAHSATAWLAGAALLLAGAAAVAAQPAGQSQPSSAMQGFSPNRDQPVKITANTLEVRDKIRQATFSGDVKLVQGDTTVSCKSLVVFYEDTQSQPAAKKAAPAPAPAADAQPAQKAGGSQQIKRAECRGDVLIVQKDQTASGETGVFDIKSNTVTLNGNVVVTQGQKVMRGDRMVANLATGVTTVDSSKSSGRVEVMLPPSQGAPGAAPAPSPPPAAKAAPKGPIRINQRMTQKNPSGT
jgi:lipopolysaccharide export system protein LptA